MNSPDAPIPEYEEDEKLRLLPRALYHGKPAMYKDAKTEKKWMWPNPTEQMPYHSEGELVSSSVRGSKKFDTIYDARVERSILTNIFKNHLVGAAGYPFRTEILQIDSPDWMSEVLQDVDGAGRSLQNFYRDRLEQKLFLGISFGLCERVGDRPYVREVEPRDMPNWTIDSDSGRTRLIEARFTRSKSEIESNEETLEWSKATAQQVYVYRAAQLDLKPDKNDERTFPRFKILTKPEGSAAWSIDSEWTPITSAFSANENRLADIPLVPFYTRWDHPFRSPPPHYDEADEQASIWRKKSEFDDRIRRETMGLDIVTGCSVETIDENGRWVLIGNEESHPYKLETNGVGLEILQKDIADSQRNIRAGIMGMLLQEDVKGNRTATEIATHEIHGTSQLGAYIDSDMGSLNTMLNYFAQLVGREGGATVNLPHKFPVMGADQFSQWIDLLESGGITDRGFWQLASLSHQVPHGFDIEAEIERKESQKVVPDI